MEQPTDRKALAALIRQAMPKVAALVAEKRKAWGDAHVTLCQVNGLAGRPGWFFAREGPIAVGTPWVDDPVMANFAAANVSTGQVVLVMRSPEEVHDAR